MSQLTVTVLQLGFLALLWVFVISVVGVVRRDLFGTRVVARTPAAPDLAAQPAPRPAPARAPAPPTPPDGGPPAPARPRTLVVTEGPLTGTSLPLGGSAITIGRAPDCTLVLPDDYASSRHARLSRDGEGRWVVEDLGSTNGTLLGRSRLEGSAEVHVGDVLRIGRTAIELRR